VAGAAVLERLRPGPPVVWRTATVREVIAETASARTLVLDVDGWPGHRAGQHLDVRLTAEDGYQAQRSYSISSAPELDPLEITVELVDEGEVSPYLVEDVRPGDEFEVRGPIGGHFTWSAGDGGPLLLVAGGSGLAPLMAMLRHRQARAAAVEAHVLVSARSPDSLLYRHELASLQPADGLRIVHTFTREPSPDPAAYDRRVDGPMLADVGPPPQDAPRCFVCGPTPFVERAADLLVAAGHPPHCIHAERFGPTGG
jgi:ferredoxin-NADP reductase